ncbi:MAG: hypothetical protein BGO10_09895 [Chlamydia sp. 32-24]|nr:MAG: hypothetical protein BGO10_09895 [Chlamydia sp. 32-24]
MKRVRYLIPAFLSFLFLFFPSKTQRLDSSNCAFCKQPIIKKQKIYEDEHALVLYTHKPTYPGHCLIIPKKQTERFEDLSDEEMLQMTKLVKKVDKAIAKTFGTKAYLLLQKNGTEVGQTVPHVHIHYVPRMEGDSSTLTFIWRAFWANINPPISDDEMQKNVSLIRQAMLDK